ncbi:MAG: ABC transporter substrate-binding protein [Solirubrobacterales bacterium]
MSKLTRPGTTLVVLLALVAALVIAGCGGGSSSSSSESTEASESSESSESTGGSGEGSGATIKIGVSPTISSVDVLYAAEQGLFEKHGVEVETTVNTTSGAATFPLLLNGQLGMTVVDPVSPILAIGKGVALRMVANGNVIASDTEEDYGGIVVKQGSGIESPKGLEGKTIAVNSLDSILQLRAEVSIEEDGGEPSAAKYVEVPPPSEVDAVVKGQVDAFSNVEPLLTTGEEEGLEVLTRAPKAMAGMPEDVIVTSKKLAEEEPEAVEGIQAAMEEANEALAKEPKLMIKTAEANEEVEPGLAEKITLPTFEGGALEASTLEALQELMVEHGYIEQPVEASELLGS